MTMWEFANNQPDAAVFIAFFAMCVAIAIVRLPFRFWNRWLRHKNIAQHGWPTAPVDADGDVIYPEKDDA